MAQELHPKIQMLLANLDEVQWNYLMRESGLSSDRDFSPSPITSSFTDNFDYDSYPLFNERDLKWLTQNLDMWVPVLFRIVDPPDDIIALLSRSYQFIRYRGDYNYYDEEYPNSPPVNAKIIFQNSDKKGMNLEEVYMASACMYELYISIAQAHHPLNIHINPPEVSIHKGSVNFNLSGGLFATGVALITACAAGMIAAPLIGTIAGGTLITVGAIDLGLQWKNQIAQAKKTNRESEKIERDIKLMDVDLELKLVEKKLKLLELRKKNLEYQELKNAYENRENLAYSGNIKRSEIQKLARTSGHNEAYTNHLINRAMPNFINNVKKANIKMEVKKKRN